MFQFPPWLLLAGGAAIGWLRNFWNWVYTHSFGQIVRRITVSVDVEEFDHADAYFWLQSWVEQKLLSRKLSALQLRKVRGRHQNEPSVIGDEEEPDNNYELVPAYGVYPFRWRDRYLVIYSSNKEDEGAAPTGSRTTFGPRRSVRLTIWGTRDRALLLRLINEARDQWLASHPTALQYFSHRHSWWRARPLPERPRVTVYMPEGLIDQVLADCRSFLGRRETFYTMGIPWRHGILFYGPPGTGKTTLVQCIATELRLPLYYLSLASISSRNDLAELLDSVQPGSILLIEDVDCIAAAADRMSNQQDENQAATPGSTVTNAAQEKITPSDLLNFIDGIIAAQGRLLILTTNYPDNLDPALVRAGRVDKKWKIDFAAEAQLLAFHAAATASGLTTVPCNLFLAQLPTPCTIADAQAALLCPELAL
jgi:chaperone BCS1